MSPTGATILKDALQLPEPDRADLAAMLIESLDSQVDEDAEAAWDTEIERRIAELDNGSVRAVPWPEARRMIMGELDGPTAG